MFFQASYLHEILLQSLKLQLPSQSSRGVWPCEDLGYVFEPHFSCSSDSRCHHTGTSGTRPRQAGLQKREPELRALLQQVSISTGLTQLSSCNAEQHHTKHLKLVDKVPFPQGKKKQCTPISHYYAKGNMFLSGSKCTVKRLTYGFLAFGE